jgi:hypothetical protein
MKEIDIDDLLKILPKLIRENDAVKGAIISALSGVVATHDDIVELNKAMEQRLDKRLEAMEQRLNKRLEASDKRIEALEQRLNKRLEASDKRIEALEQRLNKRLEASDKRIEALEQRMDKRFEEMQQRIDKRFSKLIKQMNDRFKSQQLQIDDNFRILNSKIDNLGSRAGRGLEDIIIRLLKEKEKIKDIDFSTIKRKQLVDEEGSIFQKGVRTDVDVLMKNGKTILIEIKFKMDQWDLHHFYEVSQLYEMKYEKPDELWALTLEITPKTLEHSQRFPIKLIYGKITPEYN